MSNLFYCFIQLMLFSVHKTFFDHRWADYKTDFDMMRQFFQNMNENNFQPFKKYFAKNHPQVKGNNFNTERSSYVQIYSTQFYRIARMTKLFVNHG